MVRKQTISQGRRSLELRGLHTEKWYYRASVMKCERLKPTDVSMEHAIFSTSRQPLQPQAVKERPRQKQWFGSTHGSSCVSRKPSSTLPQAKENRRQGSKVRRRSQPTVLTVAEVVLPSLPLQKRSNADGRRQRGDQKHPPLWQTKITPE